jgi:hypothetical protein
MSEPTTAPVFTLDEGLDANAITYRTVAAHGGNYRLGSLTTDELLNWLGESSDKEKKRIAGLRLAVKCICDGEGNRYPEAQIDAVVERFKKKDAVQNKELIKAAMELNGLMDVATQIAAAKNV